MELELLYLLAACLIKLLGLQEDVEFDFKVSCHSYTPCLRIKNNTTTTMYLLPSAYTEDNWVGKCSLDLSLDYEASAVAMLMNAHDE